MSKNSGPSTGLTRRAAMAAAAISASGLASRSNAAPAPLLRLGVMTDLSGPLAQNTGRGSIAAVEMAVADFIAEAKPNFEINVVSADMLNKPDVGSGIARRWFDADGVDVILDVPSSALALALATITKAKDKLMVTTGAGLTELTGKYCAPNHIQWTYDFYSYAVSMTKSLLERGDKTWFFVGQDNASGAGMQRDVSAVLRAGGGKIVGNVAYPTGEVTDFSSFLLQAQASGAKVVCFTNAGQELSNCLKQAHEFGLAQGGMQFAAVVFTINNAQELGLELTQGLVLTEAFYWDMNEGTRAFSKRFTAKSSLPIPTTFHAGCYSATTHVLKAVAAMGIEAAKSSGAKIAQQMKRMPTSDPLFGAGSVREDGKFMHTMYVWAVKSPAESKYKFDDYKLLATVPADQAFQSIAAEGCDLTPMPPQ